MRIEILCEALWILNNLALENLNNIEDRLATDYNMREILGTLLVENFVFDQVEQNTLSLEPQELELLSEILWLLANLSNYESMAFAFATGGFAEQVYLVAHSFNR